MATRIIVQTDLDENVAGGGFVTAAEAARAAAQASLGTPVFAKLQYDRKDLSPHALIPKRGESAALPTLTLSGTIITGGVLESEIVSGGQVLVMTLANAEWDAGVGSDATILAAIRAGIDSAQAEAGGWDAVIKPLITNVTMVRTSNTVVTITLPAAAGYLITVNESITVTAPAIAINKRVAVAAAPFVVTNV